MTMETDFTVVDLFCGGGGFSEGFRQAGFDIAYAADFDRGACDTYRTNCRVDEETVVEQRNVMDIEPEELPRDVDVLIGSPPCTEFSYAKQGGNGDTDEGMKLVHRFLYFVIELDPDYWIMENVPRLDDYLPDVVKYSDIPWIDDSREGELEIARQQIDADRFGTPQRRTRLFSGEFPAPDAFEEPGLKLGDIQAHFPSPLAPPTDSETVSDPIHPGLKVDADDLSDHFYNSYLTSREAKEIRVRKEDHSYYGRMSFPDDVNNQARTILAMNRRIARETPVLEEDESPEGFSNFRKPTIREIASIQGFPITYQFEGDSLSKKWRRVGDAVPPTLSFRLAQAILEEEGLLEMADVPQLNEDIPAVGTNLNEHDPSSKGRRRLSISRNFRHHVPYDDMRKFRVDLETVEEAPNHPLSDASEPNTGPPLSDMLEMELRHPVGFQVVLYRGYAKEVESEVVDFDESLEYLSRLLDERPSLQDRVSGLLKGINDELAPMVPDATTLQAIRSRRHEWDEPLEFDILESIASHPESDESGIVDDSFPREIFVPSDDYRLEMRDSESVQLDDFGDGGDVKIDHPLPVPELLGGTNLPVRVLMKVVAANYVAHKLNYCSKWMMDNPDDVFIPDDYEEFFKRTSSNLSCNSEICIEQKFRDLATNPETICQNHSYAD